MLQFQLWLVLNNTACVSRKSFYMLNRLKTKRDSWQHMSHVDVIVSVNFVPICVMWAPSFVTQRTGEKDTFSSLKCLSAGAVLVLSDDRNLTTCLEIFFISAPGPVEKKPGQLFTSIFHNDSMAPNVSLNVIQMSIGNSRCRHATLQNCRKLAEKQRPKIPGSI